MKSIKFNSDMIQALLNGNKSQTRRPIKDIGIYDDSILSINLSTDKKRISVHDNNANSFYSKEEPKYAIDEIISIEGTGIHLKIKNIRIERLFDISEEDAKREGVKHFGGGKYEDYTDKNYLFQTSTQSFLSLWHSIYLNLFSEITNPYVWVYEFDFDSIVFI